MRKWLWKQQRGDGVLKKRSVITAAITAAGLVVATAAGAVSAPAAQAAASGPTAAMATAATATATAAAATTARVTAVQATAGPAIKLIAAQHTISAPRFGNQVFVNPGIWVASLGAPLQLDVGRASYTRPVTITQVISQPGLPPQTKALPAGVLDGWNGLKNFKIGRASCRERV